VDVTTGVLANDSDADTDSTDLKTKITIDSTYGTTVLNPDGSFTYIPDPDYFGADSFEYKVSDGTGGKTTGLVTLDVLPVSEVPVSMNDAYTTDEDIPLIVSTAEGVLANDSDADTDSTDLTAAVTMVPTSGTITLNLDGSFTYTPNPDYFGDESFKYTVSDGENEVTATVAITITDVNDPPVISEPADITKEATGFTTPRSDIGLSEPTVTDLFDSTPTIINDAPETFQIGTTTVTWTATDASDNSATATQVVTIEHVTLLDQKISLAQQIEDMIGDATHKDSTYELKKAIKDITKSIDQTKWEEGKDSLMTDDGKKVFDQQRKGVKHIVKVLESGNELDQFIFDLANILLEMVDIDMQLAENMFINASNSPDADKKCIEKAAKELEKAEEDLGKDKFDKAVEHFGKVWENSKKSHDKPGKGNKSPCDPRH
jgi:VCBS repeat-containing protein